MEFRDFNETPWVVELGALDSLMSMLPRVITPDNFQAASAGPVGQKDEYTPELTVTRNVAVIPLSGYLSKRQTFFSFLMGTGNLNRFAADLDAARKDRRVRGIVAYLDSPGGPVSMIPDIADLVYRAREDKPIVTYSDGAIMSGGYWIGSAAHRIMISPVTEAGSIGVVMMHADWSKYNDDHGIKYTYLTAGKYKAEGNSDEPLPDPARKRIEGRLQDVYTVFVDAVAKHRGIDQSIVRTVMAEGRKFVGQRAVDAGLADSLGSLDDAIDLAGSGDAAVFYQSQVKPKPEDEEENDMPEIKDLTQLQAAHPDLCKQLTDAAVTDALAAQPGAEEVQAAVTSETDRILALVKIHFGDEPAGKFEAVARQDITAEQYQSMADALKPAEIPAGASDPAPGAAAGVQAGQTQQMLDAINAASAPGVGAGGGQPGDLDFMGQVKATMSENDKMTKAQAIAACVGKFPKLHKAYLKKSNTGPDAEED